MSHLDGKPGRDSSKYPDVKGIDDLRDAEEALRERERLLNSLMGVVPGSAYWALPDEHWSALFVSNGIEGMTGYPREDFTSRRLKYNDLMLPEDRAATREAVFTALRERRTYDDEHRIRHKDGSVRWIWARGHGVFAPDGSLRFIEGWSLDITPRKQAEEKLRESEQRWRSLTEALPQLVWSATPDGACDYFSTQWTEHTGVSESELLGSRWLATLHPDDREPTRRLWTDSVAGRGPYDVEYRVRRRDGVYRWFKTRGTPLRDSKGKIVKWFGTCTDITDLRDAKEALRASEERFRGTFENAAVGIAHRNATGRFLRVNEKFCTIVGYSREELLQKTMRDITYPDDQAVSIDAFTALWQGKSPTFGLEKRYVRKDGSVVWGELFASLQRDAAGNPAYDIGIINDISERKQLEEELRANEERRRLILDNAHDAFVAMSADGFIAEWNRQAEITFGWPRADAIGRVLSETIIPPQFREAHQSGLTRFLGSSQGPVLNRVLEVLALRRDGREFPAEISIAPVRLGEQCLFVAFIRDVTERRRADEELRRAKEAAEAANRAKDEFLALVSHEIRTPMNAILGMTELTLDTLLTVDQRQYLTTVKSAADALLGIINDILDFAKIEAGRLELDSADFSLSSMLDATLRALAVRAHEKGLELVGQQRPGVPDALIGDAGRLRQVLLNLVGNAIKFTERGEVVVLVETAGEPEPQGDVRLRFAVTDTGIGIPPEKQAKIFQAFEQEDASTTRKYEGTGLGLTIAARLVGLMDGQITVNSVPGQGSTFVFTARFGLRRHLPEATPASPPVMLRDLPALIVDDNATNRHILEEWLRGHAMEPTVADNAASAMTILLRGVNQGRPFPLVLLDGRMPDIDGLALAAQIREHAELSATRLILLSSGDRPGDLNQARQLGIGAYLLKPLQQRELIETIVRVMGHQGDQQGLLTSPAVVQSSVPDGLVGVPLRILVAEDNVFNRDLLEHILTRLGLSAAMAVDGWEALALLEREPFDLLLLDLHMPKLDGFQVVGAIRERERTAGGHLPVIALTARSRREDRERCLQAGMDECLTKPYSTAELWATVDRVLRKEEGGNINDKCEKTSPARSSSAMGLIDPMVLLAACGDDPAMLRKMCQRLHSLVPEDLAAVRDALHDQDTQRLREAAHKLYGTLCSFSTIAGDQAADLEDVATRGMVEEARPFVERLNVSATELVRLGGELTVETLRKLAKSVENSNRATRR